MSRIVVDFIWLSKLLRMLAKSNCNSDRSLKTVRFRLLAVSGLAQRLLGQNVITLFSDPTEEVQLAEQMCHFALSSLFQLTREGFASGIHFKPLQDSICPKDLLT